MKISIGILPLYLKLYDEVAPEIREKIDTFYKTIVNEFQEREIKVITTEVCRLEHEFKQAVNSFEEQQVDAMVTLHLAYSPSLESIAPLIATKLPIVILNTTPDSFFGPSQNSDRILFNHGIHGVQDMCSMLLRKGKKYHIESGHWQKSDVIDRVTNTVRAIASANSFYGSKVGILGESFKGMGDFKIDPAVLEAEYGIKTVAFPAQEADADANEDEIKREIEYYRTFMDISEVPEDILQENIKVSSTLKRWAEKEELDAFTCNFLAVTRHKAIKRVPFLFAAVGMYEGRGYAGEGDILTALLVSSLLKLNSETTFTEIFCPDWDNNRLFLSHMGEINPRTCPETAKLLAKPYPYSDALPPVFTTGQCMAGEALLINLIPLNSKHFRMLICPVSLLKEKDPSFEDTVRGWMRSSLPMEQFLSEYSKAGGTHHSALIYHEKVETLKVFGEQLGWEVKVIDKDQI
jgi:L-arabinose isomerase